MRLMRAYGALFLAIAKALRATRVQGLLLICLLIALAQAFVFTLVEGWTFLDGFYFAVVSMATVGYGDIAPQTSLGKASAILFLVIGIGVFVLTVTSIAQIILGEFRFTDERTEGPRAKDRNDDGPR